MKRFKDPAARARWMGTFGDLVCAAEPQLAGRIDWNAATCLYLSLLPPQTAARRYLAAHKSKGAKK